MSELITLTFDLLTSKLARKLHITWTTIPSILGFMKHILELGCGKPRDRWGVRRRT